ncbi:MAG: hypothetical protein F4X64_16025 [Chloroflexi bacterium]|nr:hypothetical protein [Chloroflexota bacterium]
MTTPDQPGDDRVLAQDISLPVNVVPNANYAQPEGWDWHTTSTSQPNAATFHISHSDVTRVFADVLTPADSPPEAHFVLKKDIPLVIIDSLDTYWAAESKAALPLNGLRVPVEADTVAEAKRKLATDLAAQLRLLLMLSTGGTTLAPQLRENFLMLSEVMGPRA